MRTLHVINSLSGSGGAEQGLVREVTRFPPDEDQLVVTLYEGGPLEPALAAAGIRHENLGLNSSRSGWNWPLATIRLRRIIAAFQPNVVHSSLFSGNLAAQLATRASATPILSTFTQSGDIDLHRLLQPGAENWYAALLRRLAGRMARSEHVWFRALTGDARDTNCAALGVDESRVQVIPRGVPPHLFEDREPDRAQLGLPADDAVVLNVGRQSRQKGHGYLIAAFSQLLERRSAHLVILGREGDGTSSLRSAIDRMGVGQHVTLIPYTDRVADYYAVADVFAFPAPMEGLGTAVLEAMASGLPVVAFDIPPVREITNDGRYAALVEVGDTDALSWRIGLALEGEILVSEGQEARDWVARQYDISRIANRVFHRLEELALHDPAAR